MRQQLVPELSPETASTSGKRASRRFVGRIVKGTAPSRCAPSTRGDVAIVRTPSCVQRAREQVGLVIVRVHDVESAVGNEACQAAEAFWCPANGVRRFST
jgi:hypothetical protein